jgi:hypothetical protein
MDRTCSTKRGEGNACRIYVGKPEGKRLLGRPSRRWLDNIKMDISEKGWGGRDWIHLTQNRGQRTTFVKTVMNHRVP